MVPPGDTVLAYADGTVRSEISQGRIGTKLAAGTPGGTYLYDRYAYDSPLEKANMTAAEEQVIAYAKIPRASIAIPTITGGMYSPDFMYVVENSDGGKNINLVIETKDVEKESDLRGTEKAKLECAKAFLRRFVRMDIRFILKNSLETGRSFRLLMKLKKKNSKDWGTTLGVFALLVVLFVMATRKMHLLIAL